MGRDLTDEERALLEKLVPEELYRPGPLGNGPLPGLYGVHYVDHAAPGLPRQQLAYVPLHGELHGRRLYLEVHPDELGHPGQPIKDTATVLQYARYLAWQADNPLARNAIAAQWYERLKGIKRTGRLPDASRG